MDRKWFAIIGIGGLAIVLVLLQFSVPSASGMAAYVSDAPALFFKKFVVLTTIVVLVMSIDYSDTVRKFVHGITPQAGIGEFYSLPVLTCAGMMWMASATDFVLIFISLELVTVSFYTLVAFTRRNPSSLEAGAKYLILGALSTGFFVYGITWIYGVTRNTNLAAIAKVLPSIPASREAKFGKVEAYFTTEMENTICFFHPSDRCTKGCLFMNRTKAFIMLKLQKTSFGRAD